MEAFRATDILVGLQQYRRLVMGVRDLFILIAEQDVFELLQSIKLMAIRDTTGVIQSFG